MKPSDSPGSESRLIRNSPRRPSSRSASASDSAARSCRRAFAPGEGPASPTGDRARQNSSAAFMPHSIRPVEGGTTPHSIRDRRSPALLFGALATTDVAHDRGYQTAFNAFYPVRRGAAWRSAFFALLQQEKSRRQPFAKVLGALHAATGRVEASFASKLAATVDPDKPVIDSFVLKNVGLRLPPPGAVEVRLVRVEQLHERLGSMYAEFLDTETGRYLVERFGEAYPEQAVTRVKMLDLGLWQTRQAALEHPVRPAR